MSEHELGDQPIEPKYREHMERVARVVDAIFNGDKHGPDREIGFVLMVYPFAAFDKGDSRCNYLSNGGDRNDVVCLMKEMIARFEGQPAVKGKA